MATSLNVPKPKAREVVVDSTPRNITSSDSVLLSNYTYEDFVWSYERNEKSISKLSQKDREKRESELPSTGVFLSDYIRNCRVLGIQPHPEISPAPIKLRNDSSPSNATTANKQKRRVQTGDKIKPETAAVVTTVSFRHHRVDMGTLLALEMTLSTCKTVHTLSFTDCKLTKRELEIIYRICDECAIQHLVLDYNGTAYVDNTTASLPLNPATGMYSIAGVTTRSFWASLTEISSLQVLSLRGNALSDVDLVPIVAALSSNKHLAILDLAHNHIGDRGMQAVAEMLLDNKTLIALTLGGNIITDTGARILLSAFVPVELSPEEARAGKKRGWPLVSAKANRVFRDCNSTLRHLSLAANPLGCTGTWLCALEAVGAQTEVNAVLGAIATENGVAATCIDHDASVRRENRMRVISIAGPITTSNVATITPVMPTTTSSGASTGASTSRNTNAATAKGAVAKSAAAAAAAAAVAVATPVVPLQPQVLPPCPMIAVSNPDHANSEVHYPLLPPAPPTLLTALASQCKLPQLVGPLLSSLALNNTTFPVPTMPIHPNAQPTAIAPNAAARARAMGRRVSVSAVTAAALGLGPAASAKDDDASAMEPMNAILAANTSANASSGSTSCTRDALDPMQAQHCTVLAAALRDAENTPSATTLGMTASRNKLSKLILQGVSTPPGLKNLLKNVEKLYV